MAVPRSAPVMPDFCRNAGRSSSTGFAACATALTLTFAGTVSNAARGLCHAKLSRRRATVPASGFGGGGAAGVSSASGSGTKRMRSGTCVGL